MINLIDKMFFSCYIKYIKSYEMRKIKMSKILEITGEIISIGLDNGDIKEIRRSDITFIPQVGDEVEIFQTETKTIVSKIEQKQEIPQGGINVTVQQSQGSTSPQYIANGTKAVNKTIYCILALLLGGLGIHKFYAGKISAGILFILFCWTCIPAIIALVDFISALCKKSDTNGNILV